MRKSKNNKEGRFQHCQVLKWVQLWSYFERIWIVAAANSLQMQKRNSRNKKQKYFGIKKFSTEAPPDGCRCFWAAGSLQRPPRYMTGGFVSTSPVMSAPPAGRSHIQSESSEVLTVSLRALHTALSSLSALADDWEGKRRERRLHEAWRVSARLPEEWVCVAVCVSVRQMLGVYVCVCVTSVCCVCQCFPGCFSASCWVLSSCCWCWPSAASPPSSPASPPSSTSSWSGSTAPRPPTAPCWSVGISSRRRRRWKSDRAGKELRFSADTRLKHSADKKYEIYFKKHHCSRSCSNQLLDRTLEILNLQLDKLVWKSSQLSE